MVALESWVLIPSLITALSGKHHRGADAQLRSALLTKSEAVWQYSSVKKTLFCLLAISVIQSPFSVQAQLAATQSQVKVEHLLQTSQSWDGVKYAAYPTGQPEVTLIKISIPPHTTLDWHRHPMISVAYILSGTLTVEKRENGKRKIVHAGQALAETVQTVHRGYSQNEPVELIVFYAGRPGLPLSIKEKR
jgi:quercetin dioxygenase-like cupin family protein